MILKVCRLKRRLDRGKTEDDNDDKERTTRDFDSYIQTGFGLATFQGPLCAEPMQGMAFFVETLEIDSDALGKEIGKILKQYF